jgi:hypothetical protein
MKLNEQDRDKFVSKLKQLNWDGTCAVCKQKEWNITDTIFEMREFQGGNLVVGGSSVIIPLVVVTCKNCGNMIFLNAIIMGMVEPHNPQEEGK